jgi:hypothetical protein
VYRIKEDEGRKRENAYVDSSAAKARPARAGRRMAEKRMLMFNCGEV